MRDREQQVAVTIERWCHHIELNRHLVFPGDGFELDDLGLEFTSSNDQRRWLSVSVKRNRQVTQERFPPDFVQAVWRQRLLGSSDEPRGGQNLMMLAAIKKMGYEAMPAAQAASSPDTDAR